MSEIVQNVARACARARRPFPHMPHVLESCRHGASAGAPRPAGRPIAGGDALAFPYHACKILQAKGGKGGFPCSRSPAFRFPLAPSTPHALPSCPRAPVSRGFLRFSGVSAVRTCLAVPACRTHGRTAWSFPFASRRRCPLARRVRRRAARRVRAHEAGGGLLWRQVGFGDTARSWDGRPRCAEGEGTGASRPRSACGGVARARRRSGSGMSGFAPRKARPCRGAQRCELPGHAAGQTACMHEAAFGRISLATGRPCARVFPRTGLCPDGGSGKRQDILA